MKSGRWINPPCKTNHESDIDSPLSDNANFDRARARQEYSARQCGRRLEGGREPFQAAFASRGMGRESADRRAAESVLRKPRWKVRNRRGQGQGVLRSIPESRKSRGG